MIALEAMHHDKQVHADVAAALPLVDAAVLGLPRDLGLTDLISALHFLDEFWV